MIVSDWLSEATHRLNRVGIEGGKLEAQVLAAHILGKDRTWIIAHPEAEIPELAAEVLLQRREAREPLAYILGYREFYGRRFEVTPDVLIPRQDTETLLETILPMVQHGPVLDIGTGSGCLAISLKLDLPQVAVWASDISSNALKIARRNADTLGAHVQFLESDLFSEIQANSFELIVSNPPYISNEEQLMPEVMGFEPRQALFSGPNGLEFYHRLATEAPSFLKPDGKLAVEVGHTQAGAVVKLLAEEGWAEIFVTKDLSGIERVVVSTWPGPRSLP